MSKKRNYTAARKRTPTRRQENNGGEKKKTTKQKQNVTVTNGADYALQKSPGTAVNKTPKKASFFFSFTNTTLSRASVTALSGLGLISCLPYYPALGSTCTLPSSAFSLKRGNFHFIVAL